VQQRDTEGITLDHVNDDYQSGDHGDLLEGASVFVPWSSVQAVLTLDRIQDYGDEGIGPDWLGDEIERWNAHHQPLAHRAVPGEHEGVTVWVRDGDPVQGSVVKTGDAGLRLRTSRFEHNGNHYVTVTFIPWASVISMDWKEPDPVANRRAREQEERESQAA
jgi:hypothetical protein